MKVAVIGAGATGLTTAYLLGCAGCRVTVVEAGQSPGGLLATFDIGGGCHLEHYYHHFFTHDTEIHWLLKQLALQDRIVYRPSSMGMYLPGTIWPFNGVLDLLRFRPISIVDRLRFGVSSLVLSRWPACCADEATACLDWFQRWAGPAATTAIWKPMLQSKFGDAAARIPLAWMAGRVRQRARSRSLRQERLGYLSGSLRVLVDALARTIEKQGGEIALGARTDALLFKGGAVQGLVADGREISADSVVATVPNGVLAGLVRPGHESYARFLDQAEYLGAICVVLTFSRPLGDRYWINVTDPRCPFAAVVEHTRLVSAENYAGANVVYLGKYLPPGDAMWAMDDAHLIEQARAQLRGMFHADDLDSWQLGGWVFRARYAAALTDIRFSAKIPAMRSPIPGLYVANTCHVYPDERSVNNAVRVSAELLREMGFAHTAANVPAGLSLAGKFRPAPQ